MHPSPTLRRPKGVHLRRLANGAERQPEIYVYLHVYMVLWYSPGMGNKTIYVRDESLWRRARKLAGKDGLSAFIQRALEEYVAEKEAEAQGFDEYRIVPSSPDVNFAQPISFTGRTVATKHFLNDPAHEEYGGGAFHEIAVAVYLTRGGKLVLYAWDSGPMQYLRIYQSLDELLKDEKVSALSPIHRSDLLESISQGVGQDWSVRIE